MTCAGAAWDTKLGKDTDSYSEDSDLVCWCCIGRYMLTPSAALVTGLSISFDQRKIMF